MKLIIDDREKSHLHKIIINKANRVGLSTEIKRLQVGDYVIGDVCFEAKSTQDFLASVLSKRIWNQVDNMDRNFSKNFVLLYGSVEDALKPVKYMKIGKGTSWNSEEVKKNSLKLKFKGAVGRLRLDYDIEVIWRDTMEQAADELITLAKMAPIEREVIGPAIIKSIMTDDVRVDVLSLIKGVSKNKARAMLKQHGSIMEIGDCNSFELTSIKGIGDTIATRVLRILNSEKKVKQ